MTPQTACALAVAEQALEFEHRDLHWGNVLVSPTTEKRIIFRLCGKEYSVPTKGVKVSTCDLYQGGILSKLSCITLSCMREYFSFKPLSFVCCSLCRVGLSNLYVSGPCGPGHIIRGRKGVFDTVQYWKCNYIVWEYMELGNLSMVLVVWGIGEFQKRLYYVQ